MQKSQERTCGFIISGSNSAIVFHSVEEAFNFVTVFVQILLNVTGFFGVSAGGNDYFCSTLCQELSKPVTIIAFVSDHRSGFILPQKRLRLFMV